MAIKIKEGFVWLQVTDKAKEVYMSGLFDVYALWEDGSETLIEKPEDLMLCLEDGIDMAIEVGHIPSEVTDVLKTLRIDAEMALAGDWDCSSADGMGGFEAQIELIDNALNKIKG
jgi:hypothetical protein